MHIIHFTVFFAIYLSVHGSIKSYNGYKVFQINPIFINQQYALERLLQDSRYDFWIKRSTINEVWTVMVPPAVVNDFTEYITQYKISYREIIENVAKIIENKEVSEEIEVGQITFNQYHNLDTINEYLKHLIDAYPHINLLILGESWKMKDIYGIKISSGSGNGNKPGILITSGLSGREWIGTATALYIIEQLANNSKYANMYDKVDWYIVPILNPDGYEYTHTTDRMWRKNLSPQNNCIGVDLTKNFDFHWSESGSKTTDDCEQEYIGPSAFSEEETITLRRVMSSLGHNIKMYLSLHAFGPMLLYPWAYTHKTVQNSQEHRLLGDEFSLTILKSSGTRYRVASYVSAMYAAGGTDTDWMKGKANIPLVYSLHMPSRGDDKFFDPNEMEIEEVAQEVFNGIKVFQQYVQGKWSNDSFLDNVTLE